MTQENMALVLLAITLNCVRHILSVNIVLEETVLKCLQQQQIRGDHIFWGDQNIFKVLNKNTKIILGGPTKLLLDHKCFRGTNLFRDSLDRGDNMITKHTHRRTES
jgi:hypothetical protein